ncbi:hypothetical protein E2C01_034093 [Portunus trituberculatus]|uniref:Uncharacterized protein n=1 Tax=Portunus trituberculatus TaxID=210409 RepID=A0A5B7F621_PORTR|nr:hypothetical protein [Portunus trituberculatus]
MVHQDKTLSTVEVRGTYIVAPGNHGGPRVGLYGALEIHVVTLLDVMGIERGPKSGRRLRNVCEGSEHLKEAQEIACRPFKSLRTSHIPRP